MPITISTYLRNGTLTVAQGGTGTTTSTGTGSVVLSNNPTITGTLTASNLSVTSTATISSSLVIPRSSTLPASPVTGNIRYNTSTLKFEGYSAGAWGPIGGSTLSSVTGGTFYVGLATTGSGSWTDARVDTGNLYYTSADNTLYATNFNTASDINLKDNVQQIDNSLDVLNKLRGVSFDWKSTGNKSYGLIAQELETVLPELVNTVDGVKSIAYIPLIGFLLEAIKELNKKLENR